MTKSAREALLTSLKQRLQAPENAQSLVSLIVDHDPVNVFDGETQKIYTISMEAMDQDNGESLGTIHIEDNVFMVYTALTQVSIKPSEIVQAGTAVSWNNPRIDYKFSEDKVLVDIQKYIDSTYTEHYSGKYQATDMIIDAGHGIGFCVGNVMKYAKRLGKKKGYNPADVMKIIHYAIILQHVLSLENGETK